MSNPVSQEGRSSPVNAQEIRKPLAGDCWSCRVLSGSGLIAAGIYVFMQAHKRNLGKPMSIGGVFQMMFATGVSAWGLVMIIDPVGRNTNK